MKKKAVRIILSICLLILLFVTFGKLKQSQPVQEQQSQQIQTIQDIVTEDGSYSSKDEVAAYIHKFGHLSSNYITKNDAKRLGYDSKKGICRKCFPGRV